MAEQHSNNGQGSIPFTLTVSPNLKNSSFLSNNHHQNYKSFEQLQVLQPQQPQQQQLQQQHQQQHPQQRPQPQQQQLFQQQDHSIRGNETVVVNDDGYSADIPPLLKLQPHQQQQLQQQHQPQHQQQQQQQPSGALPPPQDVEEEFNDLLSSIIPSVNEDVAGKQNQVSPLQIEACNYDRLRRELSTSSFLARRIENLPDNRYYAPGTNVAPKKIQITAQVGNKCYSDLLNKTEFQELFSIICNAKNLLFNSNLTPHQHLQKLKILAMLVGFNYGVWIQDSDNCMALITTIIQRINLECLN